MTTPTIDQDRDEVRRLFEKVDQPAPDDTDAERTNALIAEAGGIADRWHAEGHLVELLSPLLAEDQNKRVRYSAASILLNRGFEDLAVPALESVDLMEARVLLRYWRRQQQGTA